MLLFPRFWLDRDCPLTSLLKRVSSRSRQNATPRLLPLAARPQTVPHPDLRARPGTLQRVVRHAGAGGHGLAVGIQRRQVEPAELRRDRAPDSHLRSEESGLDRPDPHVDPVQSAPERPVCVVALDPFGLAQDKPVYPSRPVGVAPSAVPDATGGGAHSPAGDLRLVSQTAEPGGLMAAWR